AKGALIGLCLDIRLRQLSNGAYGTQEMMRDLAKKYGKDKSFVDDSLFSDIVRFTYPQIDTFFKKYVAGPEPLPFEEYFAAVGITYKKSFEIETLDPLGGYRYHVDPDGTVKLYPDNANQFGAQMNYR